MFFLLFCWNPPYSLKFPVYFNEFQKKLFQLFPVRQNVTHFSDNHRNEPLENVTVHVPGMEWWALSKILYGGCLC